MSFTTGTASASGTHPNCGAPDLCYYRWVKVEALNSGGSVIAANSNGFCEVGSS